MPVKPMYRPFLKNNRLLWAFLLILGLGVGVQAQVAEEVSAENFGDVTEAYATVGTVLYAVVTINGVPAGENDVVGMFVDSELRGKTTVSVVAGVAYLNAQIKHPGDAETVTFKVYDSSVNLVYPVAGTISIDSAEGLILGSFDGSSVVAAAGTMPADTTAPVITLTGSASVSHELGATYTDAGASATDSRDGTVTVTTSSTVDVNTAGVYTVTYSASDAATNAATPVTRTVTVATVVQTMKLKKGWNLVSFYVEASDMSPGTVFAPISSKLTQIKNLQSSYDPGIPSFLNTLSSLSVKDGYWVKVSEAVSLDVEGTVPSGASISVNSGWNLVGYPRSTGKATGDELTTLGSTVVQIKNLQSSYDPSIPSFLNTLSTMAPGSGYWLKVTADGTWTVGTVSESGAGRGLGKMGPGDVDPDWGRVVIYPNLSATVLSEVSVGSKPVSGGSVVGAFVGEELRAEQEVVLANGRSYATLNVNLTGRERVTFRIREAASGKEYRVAKVMELGLGERHGRAEELVKLNAVMAGSGVSILSYTHSPFGFSFDTGKDKSYTVEATGDLLKWNLVETIQGTGSAVQFTDTREALFEKQYYRVKTLE
jgi:hypothetical protein